ncbi:MAG TPA: hypothetical protein VGG94_04670 [Chthoniobacterales bacterium]|jgi:ABC-type oligopeptide transport system substrate-binding subunit
MKQFGWFGMLLLCGLGLCLSGCASTEDGSTQSTAPKTSVPGEDVSGGAGLTPQAGPGGAGANVHF